MGRLREIGQEELGMPVARDKTQCSSADAKMVAVGLYSRFQPLNFLLLFVFFSKYFFLVLSLVPFI